MEDDKKVREGLRVCIKSGTLTCVGCPYFNDMMCVNSLANDASDLIDCLEERISIMQESMEALEKRNEPMNLIIKVDVNGIHLACAKCGEILETLIDMETINMNSWKWNYCRVCGQAVKWDG